MLSTFIIRDGAAPFKSFFGAVNTLFSKSLTFD